MKDVDGVRFLQWLLPQLQMRWPGFRKVRRQVCNRISRRLIELGLSDVVAYQEWIVAHSQELQILDGFCRITISRFYLDRGVFDNLCRVILPDLATDAKTNGRSEVRCWSAGCASGEEPYTVNIIWQREAALQEPSVPLKIIATDSDPHMLDRARRGCYPRSSLKDFPSEWLPSCFAEVDDEFCVQPQYRSGIEWREQDIREEMPHGPFDLLFCRHLVFTYFDEPLQTRVLGEIVSRIRPGGIFVTGKQEPLPETMSNLVECQPKMGVYRKE